MGRLEVFLNAYAGICKFGNVRKTEETLADFSEKSKGLKKRKKKKIYHFASALFSKRYVMDCKEVRSMDFI